MTTDANQHAIYRKPCISVKTTIPHCDTNEDLWEHGYRFNETYSAFTSPLELKNWLGTIVASFKFHFHPTLYLVTKICLKVVITTTITAPKIMWWTISVSEVLITDFLLNITWWDDVEEIFELIHPDFSQSSVVLVDHLTSSTREAVWCGLPEHMSDMRACDYL